MTVKPKLLDLFCGAGGASRGYVDAGFDVIGVDLEAQPSYPYRFIRDDAMRLVRSSGFLAQFDAVHASPPCHDHSALRSHTQSDHGTGWMLEATIEALESSGLPFIVENVERADMAGRPFITLCGSQFDLKVRRHRRFATNFTVQPPPCDHAGQGRPVGVYGHPGGSSKRDGISFGTVDTWREAMGIDWMTAKSLAQSIPPAYTRFLGARLMEVLDERR